jgi:hypothetical protein
MMAGCGGSTSGNASSLDGTWTYKPASAEVASIGFTFNGDGTASETITAAGACSGTVTISGYLWSSTSSSFSISGTTACAGTFTCTIGGVSATESCTTIQSDVTLGGTCNYILSNDSNTLTLNQCTKSTAVPDGGVDAGSGASLSYTLTRSNWASGARGYCGIGGAGNAQ